MPKILRRPRFDKGSLSCWCRAARYARLGHVLIKRQTGARSGSYSPSLLVVLCLCTMADGRRARSPPPTPNPMVRYTDMSPVSPFFPSTYSPPSPPLSYPLQKPSALATLRARRSLLCTIAAAAVVIIVALNSAAYYTSGYSLYPTSFHESNETATAVRTSQKPPVDRLAALRGAPTMKFRGV